MRAHDFGLSILIFSLVLLLSCITQANSLDLYPKWGPIPQGDEILPPPPPPPTPLEANFGERLFNKQLENEIMARHDDLFGPINSNHLQAGFPEQNEVEFGYESRIYQGAFIYQSEKTAEFGEFIGRKMLEIHVDNTLKNEPALNPIYKAKKQLTNAEVKASKTVSIKANYSISGNYLKAKVHNPLINFETILEMGPPNSGPGTITETIIKTTKDINKKTNVGFKVKTYDSIFGVIVKHKIDSYLNVSLTASTPLKNINPEEQEHLWFLSLSGTI